MSISEKLVLLQQDITNARSAVVAKGGTITPSGGSSQLATDIATIPSGSEPVLKDISPITQNGTYAVFDDLIVVDSFVCTGQGSFRTDISLTAGTQYNYEVSVNLPQMQNDGTSIVFGANYSSGTNKLQYYKSGSYTSFNVYTSNRACIINNPTTGDVLLTTDFSNSKVYLNGTQYTTSSASATSGGYTLDILSINNEGSHENYFIGTFKYLKIFDLDFNLLYHFVPARNSNNEPLLYDKVTMKIYTLTGSGITPGSDVSDESYDGFASPLVVNIDTSKYGATINGILGNTDANGNYTIPTEQISFDFTGIKSIPEYSFYYKFYRMQNIIGVNFHDLQTVGNYGLQYAFGNVSLTDGNIITLDISNLTTVGTYGLAYAFYYQKLTNVNINLPLLTSVAASSFTYAFFNSNISGFHADSLTSITANSAFSYTFAGTQGTSSTYSIDVTFNNLQTIKCNFTFNNAFNSSGAGQDMVFHPCPKLQKINGYGNFSTAFLYCHTKRVVFDKLEYIGDETDASYGNFQNAFQYARMRYETGHTNDYDRVGLFMSSLKVVGKNSASSRQNFSGTFINSNNMHTAHFYELTTVYNTSTTTTYGQFAQFNAKRVYMPKVTDLGTNNKNCFYSSTSTEEIHFGIENQATIQAMTGYSTKFGATNATILFDMANHITYNGVSYLRDGAACDLDNWYFAWQNPVIPTEKIYTTDFKCPQVGDTVYTKSGDTYTAVGTVEAYS